MAKKMCEDEGAHGYNEKKIIDCIKRFEQETKEERKKFATAHKFNEAILGAKKGSALASKCKGLFVGNIFLKNAQQQQHVYLMAWSSKFIIIVPFGPIQSVIHILAIPKVPLYNAVSVGPEHSLLLEEMQAALVKVATDILTPGSRPQALYLWHLSKAFDLNDKAMQNIRITQEAINLNTAKMDSQKAVGALRDMLKDYYDEKKKLGIPLDQVVSTDLHLHDQNSVGQLHMHGWIAEPELITDNGVRLLPKNTPMDRLRPVMNKYLGVGQSKKPRIVVRITNEFEKTE